MFLILITAASSPGSPEIAGPDLNIAVGVTANPVNRSSQFSLVVTNTGSADTPSPTRDKLILYYWGTAGQDPPRALKEVFITTVPVIRAGEIYVFGPREHPGDEGVRGIRFPQQFHPSGKRALSFIPALICKTSACVCCSSALPDNSIKNNLPTS